MEITSLLSELRQLLKSDDTEDWKKAYSIIAERQLAYELPEYYELAHFLERYERSINPYSKLAPLIQQFYSYTWFELEGRDLSYLPKEISLLRNLKTFHLESNSLNELPSSFSDLVKLEKLYLGNNNFEKIPEQVYELPNLTLLMLSNNPLSEEVLEAAKAKLPKVQFQY